MAAIDMSLNVSNRGAARWAQGHPWIYASDVVDAPDDIPAGAVLAKHGKRPIGVALYSPKSEIALRLIDRDPNAVIDEDWWRRRLAAAVTRRASLADVATAYRLVHGEADGCPSLVVDKYDRWLVVQLASAGVERYRNEIVSSLREMTGAEGILARNDLAVRVKEGLPKEVEVLSGDVPGTIDVQEYGLHYLAAPWDGQKTGAFLDQRENRARIAALARAGGRALDCFSYHGSFALHLARRSGQVLALDTSAAALERAKENAARNEITNISFVETDAFEYLKAAERARERFDTVVLDPPAFAKTKRSLGAAARGYKEINLRGMRLLAPGGLLYTASCSFHLSKADFLAVLQDAAADSGRRIALREILGQPIDHPEILTIPETGYLKGAIAEALD
ncbi:MAG TPA: class I SAM-dependent rRNA methyltransferase [Gemmatimonadaceae bacterium]|nr:class I SAM-dependent rRNA methyltransferase [Gemmatimonadaceae bacterium]